MNISDKRRYHALDDLMPLGSQEKISPAKRKHIIKKTGEAIRAIKAKEAKLSKSKLKKS